MSHRTPELARALASLPTLRARRELASFLRRFAMLAALLALLVAAGTLAFVLAEDVSAWRGFVWTLDTVATVGSVPEPDDAPGQSIKVTLIVLGVGTLFYALVTVTEFFVAGHLSGLLEQRRTMKMIDSLSDHYLICGFGRVGRQVARDLRAANARYVVVDADPANREFATGVDVRFIEAQPSDDD